MQQVGWHFLHLCIRSLTPTKEKRNKKHRVTIPCKWSFEKRHFSRKAALFTWKAALFTNGLPSVLYETPGLNERSVMNQLFLLVFSVAFCEKCNAFREKRPFSWKAPLFMKSAMLFVKSATLFMKSAMLFTVSFSVITKYRSFFRKTNQQITKFTVLYHFIHFLFSAEDNILIPKHSPIK